MDNTVVLSPYDLYTLSESILCYLMGSDHPVLRRSMGPLFKGDMDGGKKVRTMLVLIVSRVMREEEAVEASEAEDQTEMMQNTTWNLATTPQPW